jgi:hypothetical protein
MDWNEYRRLYKEFAKEALLMTYHQEVKDTGIDKFKDLHIIYFQKPLIGMIL